MGQIAGRIHRIAGVVADLSEESEHGSRAGEEEGCEKPAPMMTAQDL